MERVGQNDAGRDDAGRDGARQDFDAWAPGRRDDPGRRDPGGRDTGGRDFHQVADLVAARIRRGELRPGDRLPTQRDFARRHAIAPSTAARVYRELARRGLTVGEVGRGTFVRAAAVPDASALSEPAGSRIDLELNHPVAPGQAALLAPGLDPLLRPDVLAEALRPVGAAGTPAARHAAASLLARGGWFPDPDRVLFAGNGRQATAAAIAALVPPGARLGAEELTYPVLKTVAARLGVTLVPLAMDDDGLVPEAVEEANRRARLHAVYLQPTLHNPLSVTMPGARAHRLADVLLRTGVHAVEDGVWGFLRDDLPPLAALAPERTVLIDSLSKRLAPGLTAGFAVAPAALTAPLAAALRSGGWTPPRFALEAAARWQADGTADALVRAKQREAGVRQEIAARHLGGYAVRGDRRSYYCWWELPAPWRADTFVAAAARRGIGVTPAAAFAVGRHRAPNAVRLGLASPDVGDLDRALAVLAALARSAPEDDMAG
ncbi:PLP-dependent aminotransferase family protein [Streptomyces avicenniae]|uniref:aminotransferase-like domain-containing protein n=1 Tax=Streptomyces avicenniae TaxID=500153 RepID=UPI000DA62A8C|nr:PLP-dependent aminotransferase family protein [Streptomyces avicenniae]